MDQWHEPLKSATQQMSEIHLFLFSLPPPGPGGGEGRGVGRQEKRE